MRSLPKRRELLAARHWKGGPLKRCGLIIRAVYALCLAGATINHVRAVLARGWLPQDLPRFTALYWASLTFLDPLAVILLFVSPRAGIILTTLIIVSDVMHNLLFIAAHGGGSGLYGAVIGNPFVMSQILFLLFVSATAPLAWRAACPKIERTVDARLRQASEPTQM